MQVSVEKTSEIVRKMTVNIPEEVVQEKMEARFKSLAREIKLDGFRPGKVPVSVVKKQYGNRVRGEILGDLMQSSYFDALTEQSLNPAGQPHIVPDEQKEGLQYVAEFEVYPTIELDNLENLALSRMTAEVGDSDLNEMIDKLREQKKDWREVERASQQGDRVTIHFSGESEGENFTDGKVEDFKVEIGAKQMISGFEDALIGLQKGEAKSFEATFPEGYGNPKLSGKTAQFDIELVGVEEAVIPELNEEFIVSYGIEDGDLAAFQEDIRNNMERELGMALSRKLKNQVMDAVYENVSVTLPNALVDQEIESMTKSYVENAKRQNITPSDDELAREQFEEQARRRVALGLILSDVIQKHEINVDNERVKSTLEDLAQGYGDPDEIIKWYYQDESRLNEIKQMVLEDQVVDWIVSHAQVTDEAVSFEDAMN